MFKDLFAHHRAGNKSYYRGLLLLAILITIAAAAVIYVSDAFEFREIYGPFFSAILMLFIYITLLDDDTEAGEEEAETEQDRRLKLQSEGVILSTKK